MSKGTWRKPVKCERGDRCGYCRACQVRDAQQRCRDRKAELRESKV